MSEQIICFVCKVPLEAENEIVAVGSEWAHVECAAYRGYDEEDEPE